MWLRTFSAVMSVTQLQTALSSWQDSRRRYSVFCLMQFCRTRQLACYIRLRTYNPMWPWGWLMARTRLSHRIPSPRVKTRLRRVATHYVAPYRYIPPPLVRNPRKVVDFFTTVGAPSFPSLYRKQGYLAVIGEQSSFPQWPSRQKSCEESTSKRSYGSYSCKSFQL
jgi:hypothetical protein